MLNRTPIKKPNTLDDMKGLIHKRGQVKAKVTRIFNSLETAEREKKKLALPVLRVHARNLQNFYVEYNEIHDAIIAATNEENADGQEEKYLEFEEVYNETLVIVETLIEAIEKENRQLVPLSVPGPSTSTAVSQSSNQPVVIHTQSYRAPLPTFDGRYEAWPRFKAMFVDMMQRSNDSDAVKLYHLENALKGDAAGVIDLETLQNNNYARAWEILEERFGNKRLILETHILGLLNMKKVPRKSSKDLRNLVDECTRHVDNLVKLDQRLTGMSQLFVVTLLTRALDDQTRELWEASFNQAQLPKYEEMIEFLKQRVVILERCETVTPAATAKPSNPKPTSSKGGPSKSSHAATSASEYTCNFCGGQHQNFKCPTFLKMTVEQRQSKLKEANLCYNCLRWGHRSATCSSDKVCGKCSKKHHSLIHYEPRVKPEVQSEPPKPAEVQSVPAVPEQPVNASCSSVFRPSSKQVFLMTAMVNLLSKSGQVHQVRALLDSGSQINLLSESLVNKLNLPKYPANVPVIGVGGKRSQIRHRVAVRMTSSYNDFATIVDCLVTPKVTGTIPSANVNVDSWRIPSGIVLADATFNQPQDIEMLIGAEHFFNVLKQGQIKLANHLPTLFETQFGWVVAGSYEDTEDDLPVYANLAVIDGLEACLQRFFDQEEIAEPATVTTEEERFEEHFQRTFRRNEDGRFVVQLPFRDTVSQLGSSRSLALKRFLMLEKKLARDPELKAQYAAFIEEYQELGHCREVKEDEDPPGLQTYYLPHHCILKPSSSSTKLRVVFDATAKASDLSLNDVLMTGPNNQSDLFSIVLRFRTHAYVFSVDVSKMYRQILIDPSQTQYQRIFWRNHPSEELKVLELLTVTYGTSAASFLAVRSLIQLGCDERDHYPEAAEVILNDSYMDDVLSGSDSIESTKKLRCDLETLMLKGGFPIRKWCSNSEEVLEGIPDADRETLVPIQESSANEVIKALGLLWDPKRDLFLFNRSPEATKLEDKTTKRNVLSQIARLFDPLGLVSPVIVEAKMIMQCLWAAKIGWDDPLEGELLQRWEEFQTSLAQLCDLEIPRCVVVPDSERMEIHGFADASKYAYGACVFLRCIGKDGSAVSHLLCSKSKVAPLRDTTIPRLELCAAQLLAKLVDKVVPTLKLKIEIVELWSDSQIVLAWMKKPLDRLQVYVRNRVTEINRLTEGCRWGYVNTAHNPADIVSRGMKPVLLSKCQLWWNGPTFLREASYEMEPAEDLPDHLIPELRDVVVANPIVQKSNINFDRFDSFYKLQRVYAQIARFVRRIRIPKDKRDTCGRLTVQDMRKATGYIVRVLQQSELQEEIQCVQRGEVPKQLATLQPFLDEDGFLRVGGRLQNSNLPFDAKHQLLLPQKHRVTELLIKKIHEERLHERQSGVLAAIRQKIWLVNARSTIRKVIHQCVRCFRTKPRTFSRSWNCIPTGGRMFATSAPKRHPAAAVYLDRNEHAGTCASDARKLCRSRTRCMGKSKKCRANVAAHERERERPSERRRTNDTAAVTTNAPRSDDRQRGGIFHPRRSHVNGTYNTVSASI